MTVFFRASRGHWYYEFEIGGVRHSKECRRPDGEPATCRRDALEAEADAKRQARIAPKLPRASDLAFGEVMNALADGWAMRPDWKTDRMAMVQELLDFFGKATPIRAIDGARIQDYITFSLSQSLKVWMGGPAKKDPTNPRLWKLHPTGAKRSAARTNRYLVILRATFERAYNTRDPLTRARAIDEIPEIKDLTETKRKARPAPEAVLTRAAELLPQHVVDGLVVTLSCGFRRDEAFGLTEPQVDWDAAGVRLKGEDVKDGEDAYLPISQFALGYLRCLAMEADDRGTRHLITWRPAKTTNAKGDALRWRPIKSPKSAWKTAMKIIQAEFGARWRWHDVRAAFITKVALESGPLAAQRLARHSDFKTTQAYIEVADNIMREAAERAVQRPVLAVVNGGKGR